MTTTSEPPSPALTRARRVRRRAVGLWLILGGLVLVALAIFVLVAVETTVFGAGSLIGCGSAVSPVSGRGDVCTSALIELWLVGGAFAVAGIGALTCGVLLRALTPRPLGF